MLRALRTAWSHVSQWCRLKFNMSTARFSHSSCYDSVLIIVVLLLLSVVPGQFVILSCTTAWLNLEKIWIQFCAKTTQNRTVLIWSSTTKTFGFSVCCNSDSQHFNILLKNRSLPARQWRNVFNRYIGPSDHKIRWQTVCRRMYGLLFTEFCSEDVTQSFFKRVIKFWL